jgi:hypothetical protein
MALYSFSLEKIHIDTTRALGDDSDTVKLALQLGPSASASKSASTGDVDGGDVGINLSFPPQFLATGDNALMTYFVYNGDTSKLSVGLDELSKNVIDEYVKQRLEGGPSRDPQANIPDDPQLRNNATYDDPSWVNVLEFAALGRAITDFFFPDCDGMVAADAIARSKFELDAAIDAAGGTTFRQTRRYPGSDSPTLCGANSDYTVTWSVSRVRETAPGPHSLRAFANAHGIRLQPGVRSLRRAGLSIRDFIM